MASLKLGKGWAPLSTLRTLTFGLFGSVSPRKKLGVPLTPAFLPSARSIRIAATCFPLSKHSWKLGMSNPSA